MLRSDEIHALIVLLEDVRKKTKLEVLESDPATAKILLIYDNLLERFKAIEVMGVKKLV